MRIPFNKPHFTGSEVYHLSQAAMIGKLSGNGDYTKKCQQFFEERYGIHKALLTTSCSDALEMSALLCNIEQGDEVIMPSYTFVSTANAFALRGAKIVFTDSTTENPNLNAAHIENLITPRTKVIVVMHYGGIACEMDSIMQTAAKHGLIVVEDAAQGVDAYYKGKPLGTIGTYGTYSFHETKNITSGEGGLLIVNDPLKSNLAEVLWEKGTNRAAFARGEVEKYEWVSLGGSYLPNELTAAFLYAQLQSIDDIQQKRLKIWNTYYNLFREAQLEEHIQLPNVPDDVKHNGHLFYITVSSHAIRDRLLTYLHEKGIHAVFHYLALHRSPYYKDKHDNRPLPHAERYADTLLRLPFYYSLEEPTITEIVDTIKDFFRSNRQKR